MTAKIVVGPKYCRIENEDDSDFLRKLDKHLSFKYAGADFMPMVKRGLWNGVEHLLTKKLVFMSGLLNNVKDFYHTCGKEVKIEDLREQFIKNESIDIIPNLNKLGIEPYDYQLKAVDVATDNERVIFKHATGSGKSITAALITARLNKSTIIYVISKDLLFQFHDNFSKYFNEKIGIVGAGHFDIQRITIASIWTIGRALGMKKAEMIQDSDLEDDYEIDTSHTESLLKYVKSTSIHIFDECHVAGAKTIQNIYKIINVGKIYGMSGTPVRDDNSDLLIEGIFSNKIDTVSASELIKRKILARPFILFIYNKSQIHYTAKYAQVYSEHIVNNNIRNNIIINEAKKLIDKKYQVLILFRTIAHGNILHKLCKEANINCDLLNGKDKEEKRKSVLIDVKERKIDCLIASSIFNIGLDAPTLSALVLASPNKGFVLTMQRVGRVLRNGKEKPQVAVIDFWDDVMFLKKHSKTRNEIYKMEDEFVIKLPKEINAKKE